MNYYKSILLILVLLSANAVTAQTKNDSLYRYGYDTTNYSKMRDSLMKVYQDMSKDFSKGRNVNSNQKGLGSSFFGLNLDVIFGVGISNTTFDLSKDTAGLNNTGAKVGPMIGVNINLNLVGFALSTGFNYSSKGFTTNNSESHNANYINIPLMFAYNFNIKKVEIDIAAGPYVGILLSKDESQLYAMKNLDIGIVGTLQGTYFFNRFLGALVGVKYEHGGLNNLMETGSASNQYISAIKTRNWFIYSGIKFVL